VTSKSLMLSCPEWTIALFNASTSAARGGDGGKYRAIGYCLKEAHESLLRESPLN